MNDTGVLYRSDRFVITGRMNCRVVITDTQTDTGYVLVMNELKKFRDKFFSIKKENKDTLIIAILSNPNIKSAL